MTAPFNYKPGFKGAICGAIWYTTPCEMETIEAAFEKVYKSMESEMVNKDSGLTMARLVLEELDQLPPQK